MRVFLASSSELREDRDEFDLYFCQQNNSLVNDGIYLTVVRWEHFLDAMSATRPQDEYDQTIREVMFLSACSARLASSLKKSSTSRTGSSRRPRGR